MKESFQMGLQHNKKAWLIQLSAAPERFSFLLYENSFCNTDVVKPEQSRIARRRRSRFNKISVPEKYHIFLCKHSGE